MKTDKLNDLYESHKSSLPGRFHNALWQIMVNETITGAFYALADGELVVALYEGGYVDCYCAFEAGVDRKAIVDDLNREVFGLDRAEALEVVAISMRGREADSFDNGSQ